MMGAVCAVPGCGAVLSPVNVAGVCRAHNHATGLCRCQLCVRKSERSFVFEGIVMSPRMADAVQLLRAGMGQREVAEAVGLAVSVCTAVWLGGRFLWRKSEKPPSITPSTVSRLAIASRIVASRT
jgi:hypothetical protein